MAESIFCEVEGCERMARYNYAIDRDPKNRKPENRMHLCIFHHAEKCGISPKLNEVKTRVKYFIKAQQSRIGLENFIRNYAWMELISPSEMFDILEKLTKLEKECEEEIGSYFEESSMEIHEYLTSIPGIAHILAGKFIGSIDINDPRTKSVPSLWRYVGYDPEHVRRTKGMSEEEAKKCGVPALKAFCYQAGDCLIKLNFEGKKPNKKSLKYRSIYEKDKKKELKKVEELKCENCGEKSFDHKFDKIKKRYECPNGKTYWKYTKTDSRPTPPMRLGHADMRARRKMMKVFLKDLFVEWKKIEAN